MTIQPPFPMPGGARRLAAIAALAAACGASPPAAAADPALAGLKEMKLAFDITEANPKALLVKLATIEETRDALARQGVTPRFVLAFRGEASRFTQTDVDKIRPEDREAAARVAAALRALRGAEGVEAIEQCSLPMRSRNIRSEDLLPEVRQVPNGWISLAAYQHRGYAYIAP